MSTTALRRSFDRGEATAAEIEDVVREVLDELADPDGAASAAARDAGLDPAALADARVEVREGAQGLEPVLTSIVVSIAVKAGSAVAASLWSDVLWPPIRRRLGVRALGPEKKDAERKGTGTGPGQEG